MSQGHLRCQNGFASLDLALKDEACALARGQAMGSILGIF